MIFGEMYPWPGDSGVLLINCGVKKKKKLHDSPINPFKKWLPGQLCSAGSPVRADIRAFSLMKHAEEIEGQVHQPSKITLWVEASNKGC